MTGDTTDAQYSDNSQHANHLKHGATGIANATEFIQKTFFIRVENLICKIIIHFSFFVFKHVIISFYTYKMYISNIFG